MGYPWTQGEELLATDLNAVTEGAGIKVFVAGETIDGTPPKPVCLGSSDIAEVLDQYFTDADNASAAITTTTWIGQTFTTGATIGRITKIDVKFAISGAAGTTPTIELYATSGGLPTGSAIASQAGEVAGATNGGANTLYQFRFSSPVTVSPNTLYAFVIKANGTGFSLRYNSSGGYSGGNRITTTNSGSSYSSQSGDVLFRIWGAAAELTAGRVYYTKADRFDLVNYIGFAITDANSGNDITVQTSGIVTGLSGLTAGKDYYLSDSAGGISTTPGTIKIKVGKAITATTLLIQHSGKVISGLTAFKNLTKNVNTGSDQIPLKNYSYKAFLPCGFSPKIIRIEAIMQMMQVNSLVIYSYDAIYHGTTLTSYFTRGNKTTSAGDGDDPNTFQFGLQAVNNSFNVWELSATSSNYLGIQESSSNTSSISLEVTNVNEVGFEITFGIWAANHDSATPKCARVRWTAWG